MDSRPNLSKFELSELCFFGEFLYDIVPESSWSATAFFNGGVGQSRSWHHGRKHTHASDLTSWLGHAAVRQQ